MNDLIKKFENLIVWQVVQLNKLYLKRAKDEYKQSGGKIHWYTKASLDAKTYIRNYKFYKTTNAKRTKMVRRSKDANV